MGNLSKGLSLIFLVLVSIILFLLFNIPTVLGNDCKNIKNKNVIIIPLPMTLKLINGTPITKVKLHKDLKIPLLKALNCVNKNGYLNQIKTYDGGYCYRNIRKTGQLSLHARGRAVDFNARWNRYGRKPTLHPTIVHCFEVHGFVWGGRWKTPDGMHFQYEDTKHRSKPPICSAPFGC